MAEIVLPPPETSWLRQLRRRIGDWAESPRTSPVLELAIAGVALLVGLVSYAVLTSKRAPAEGFSPQMMTLLLVANLLPLLALLVLIGRRIAVLFANRRAGRAGAQLHVRLVALFAALSAAPTLLVVIFASLLFQFGVQFWFSDRAKTVLDNADRVAEAYVEEARFRILGDVNAMADDATNYWQGVGLPAGASFADGLAFQSTARRFSDVVVFRDPGKGQPLAIIASAGTSDIPLSQRLQGVDLGHLPAGQGRLLGSANDRMDAVVRLETPEPLFLYVSSPMEPRVLEQVARTQAAISDYQALTSRSRALQWRFNLMLLVMSLLVVSVAVWFAIVLASRMVTPIGELAAAAEQVGGGNLDARVDIVGAGDEIATLASSFNRMTEQLKAQQQALISANTQAELRRQLTEAVLSGVSAGVLSIDQHGVIRIANARAEALLRSGPVGLSGRLLADAAPEFLALLEDARREGVAAADVSRTIDHPDRGQETQTLAVRLTADSGSQPNIILTFDDITQQIADQRRAAWSDVARRIAHEIKNPLTPIVLSAERLKRRFGPQVLNGRQTFDDLTETIVRQVGDLRRMVDEFSAFARMPMPTFHAESLGEIARQAVFLAEVATPGISYRLDIPDDLPVFVCDRRQIGQAFTNLLKNAAEAILASDESGGEIHISLRVAGPKMVVDICDTGVGIPPDMRERLFEPYVTTRQRGTGLGLAIVKRIIEDHHGHLDILNRTDGVTGAIVRIEFDLAVNHHLEPVAEKEKQES